MSRQEGIWGEAFTANYLRDRGWKVIASGYQCRFGEIDLIALDGKTLCFVEVKTRANLDMALPREYVTAGKQSRIKKRRCFIFSSTRNTRIRSAALMWRRSMRRTDGKMPA